MCQGYGLGPIGWISVSNPIIKMMKEAGFGYKDWMAISKEVFQLVCFAYMDDTDIIHTKKINNETQSLIQEAQEALDMWNGVLNATGGELVPEKSYWYYIDFVFNNNGTARYKTIKELPGKLYLTNGKEKCEVNRKEVTESRKSLGTHFPPNGSNKNNISYFRKKAELWADRIRTNKLSVHDAWTALKTTITRTLEYPLTASTMT